jgi:hypothetical protein
MPTHNVYLDFPYCCRCKYVYLMDFSNDFYCCKVQNKCISVRWESCDSTKSIHFSHEDHSHRTAPPCHTHSLQSDGLVNTQASKTCSVQHDDSSFTKASSCEACGLADSFRAVCKKLCILPHLGRPFSRPGRTKRASWIHAEVTRIPTSSQQLEGFLVS